MSVKIPPGWTLPPWAIPVVSGRFHCNFVIRGGVMVGPPGVYPVVVYMETLDSNYLHVQFTERSSDAVTGTMTVPFSSGWCAFEEGKRIVQQQRHLPSPSSP